MSTLRRLQAAAFVSSYDRSVTPVLLLPMASGFGVSLETMSAAATLYYLMYGLMQPVWAIISDRIGRVVLVRLGLAIAALAGFACVVSTTPSLVIGARAVSGAAGRCHPGVPGLGRRIAAR